MNTEGLDRGPAGTDSQQLGTPRQRGWWGRNWLWFVPVLLLAIVVIGGAVGYWALFLRVYDLEVCSSAMRTIQADKQVREALGEPIQTVKWPSRTNAPSARVEERETDIQWHIEGSKGHAKAHVFARLMMGKWEPVTLEVKLDSGKTIAVQQADNTGAEAPVFAGSKPEAKKSEEKKPEKNAPGPEINMTLPPDSGPPAK